MTSTLRPLAVALALLCAPAHADDAQPSGSVAVTTVPARQGSLPRRIIAYGTAGPAANGSTSLSLQQDGRVAALMVAPGQVVRSGQELLTFAASANAASAYQQAVSALALAKSQRAHARQLLGQQLATRDQLAQADKAVGDAQSTVDALHREGAGNATQQLTAPFDGIVSAVSVAQGDRVAAGATLLVLTRNDGTMVQVGLEPDQRAQVQPGQQVLLRSLDGSSDTTGQVRRIAGALDPKSHLLNADITVPVFAVLSGGAYRAAIAVGVWQGWLVPHAAVLTDADGDYLFQRDGDKARRVVVQVLGTDTLAAQSADVVDGRLDPRLAVVVDGAAQLEDGDPVRDAGAAGAEAAPAK